MNTDNKSSKFNANKSALLHTSILSFLSCFCIGAGYICFFTEGLTERVFVFLVSASVGALIIRTSPLLSGVSEMYYLALQGNSENYGRTYKIWTIFFSAMTAPLVGLFFSLSIFEFCALTTANNLRSIVSAIVFLLLAIIIAIIKIDTQQEIDSVRDHSIQLRFIRK